MCNKEVIISPTSLSILLATYNGGKYISKQLDSLINQSYKDWTLYIHDDGSTDDTVSIIRYYTEKFKNIILIVDDKKNLGSAQNFKHLLSIVESDIYMFCDQDDIWLPNKIEKSVNTLTKAYKSNPQPIIVHTDLTMINQNDKVLEPSLWTFFKIRPEILKHRNYVLCSCYMTGCTMCFNKEAKKYLLSIPNEFKLHDQWMAIEAAFSNASIISIAEPTILYRQHNSNVTKIGHSIKKNFTLKIFLDRYNHKIKGAKPLMKKFKYGSVLKFLIYSSLYTIRR